MKKITLLFFILLSLKSFAQSGPDAIFGKWMVTPKENLSIDVYKKGNEYIGKILSVKDNGTAKPGFIILEKLKYNPGSKTWTQGKIHNPKGGGTYSATAKIKEDGTLEVHAYKGFKFLGTNKVFRRI